MSRERIMNREIPGRSYYCFKYDTYIDLILQIGEEILQYYNNTSLSDLCYDHAVTSHGRNFVDCHQTYGKSVREQWYNDPSGAKFQRMDELAVLINLRLNAAAAELNRLAAIQVAEQQEARKRDEAQRQLAAQQAEAARIAEAQRIQREQESARERHTAFYAAIAAQHQEAAARQAALALHCAAMAAQIAETQRQEQEGRQAPGRRHQYAEGPRGRVAGCPVGVSF